MFLRFLVPPPAQAIIDPALWDAVQARLAENAFERAVGIRVKNPSLLAGSLFDGEVQRMTPTYAVENGKRYCYYVSRGWDADGVAVLRPIDFRVDFVEPRRQ